MLDLHIHSNASDGQYPPDALAQRVKDAGVSLWALTDHDTLDGIPQARQASQRLGLRFIPGIELSAKGNRELHILGYGVDIRHEGLRRACETFQEYREIRSGKIIGYLENKQVYIHLDDVRRLAGGELLGRPHFARAMVEAGYVSSVREAFDRYLGTPEFDAIERPKPSPQEAVALIRDAGGVAVLAHPKQLKLREQALEGLVADLAACGLQGMECYYSTHTREETAYYLFLAQRFNLRVTCGSDFHGEKVKPDIAIGTGIQASLCGAQSAVLEWVKALC